jgi:hypothetical protein
MDGVDEMDSMDVCCRSTQIKPVFAANEREKREYKKEFSILRFVINQEGVGPTVVNGKPQGPSDLPGANARGDPRDDARFLVAEGGGFVGSCYGFDFSRGLLEFGELDVPGQSERA